MTEQQHTQGQRVGKRGPIPRTLVERIAAKVVRDANGCHIWQGSTTMRGYPQVQMGSTVDGTRRPQKAHRALVVELRGPVPEGYDVHHTCENKLCLNPDHLVVITHAEHSRTHGYAAAARAAYAAGARSDRPRKQRSCEVCGADITLKRIDATTCSPKCNHARWKARQGA